MSGRFLCVFAAVIAFAAAVGAQFNVGQPKGDIRAGLNQEVQVTSDDVADVPLFEVLSKIAKKHKVVFVINEEAFRAKKVENAKEKKSAQKIDTKGLSVEKFLEAWLPNIGATHRVRPDYVEIVPVVGAAVQDEPEKAKLGDPLANLLNTLHGDEVQFEGNLNDIPLFELLQKLSARHKVNFVINEEAFRSEAGVNDIKDKRPILASTELRGPTLHTFLTTILNSMGATYMLKGKSIEIVPTAFAARQTEAALDKNYLAETSLIRLAVPLVSATIRDKSLTDSLMQIAERYDLTVIVSPQAGEAKKNAVTARLLNVPADKAIELLAVQHDLRVVRKGTAYLVTSKEHADTLFAEEMEKERAKIELEKFRATPPPKQE